MALAIFDRMCEHGPLSFIGISGIAVLAWWLGTDYDWRGVLMIAVFYILRHQTMRPWLERSSTNYLSLSGYSSDYIHVSFDGSLRHSRCVARLRNNLPV